MSEYILKREKSAKTFKIIVLALFVAYVILFIIPAAGIVEFDSLVIPIAVLPTVLFVLAIVYYVVFHPVMSSISWLKENNYINTADDIVLDRPTLPKSKIFCGKNALFCNKPFAIIPYSEIGWVHLYVRKTNGITVEKAVIVYTRDGKKFSLRSDENEFQWLLENYIVKYSPNTVIGYGKEQKMRYRQLNPNYKIAKSKTMKKVGIAFLCIAAFFFIMGIVNFKTVQVVTVAIIILICSIVGMILLLSSKNNKKIV